MKNLPPGRHHQRGMTLVEILVASTISLVVVTIGLRFVIQTLKSYQYETGKLLVNRDIRQFTEQMIRDATYANDFLIFDQKSNLTRATGETTVVSGGTDDPLATNYRGYTVDKVLVEQDDSVSTPTLTSIGTAKVDAGLPGDVVVFVYFKDGDNAKINQLVVYYRDIATTSASNGTNSTTLSDRTKALRRIVVKPDPTYFNDNDSTHRANWKAATVLKLLPDLSKVVPPLDSKGAPKTVTPSNATIFPFVDGQANDTPPTGSNFRCNKMFYNINNTSVLVRGRIYENYTPSGAIRLVKSTYNFTVTPRG